ncbi:MAG: DNA repair protein RadA [Candidatus Berkelbacteria bacterium]
MIKKELIFICSNCGEEYIKWQGKCDNCSQWGTLKEFKVSKDKNHSGYHKESAVQSAVTLENVKITDFNRVSTNISEFDRVLGGYLKDGSSGGIVPGSIMLLGGDPGIGKSTLLLQVASNLKGVLYVSGEESVEQIKMRFDRLKLKSPNLKLLAETDLSQIQSVIAAEKPEIVIIDSIQTIYSSDFPSTPGSIVQVRECAMRLQSLAKSTHTSVILVGHVTKDGSVAGPKILEHLVDVVLYLEGDNFQNTRILRGVKNRFGATDEIGIFEMNESGLVGIDNPSKMFLEERMNNVAGSVVTAAIEGTRALLLEVQALTTKSSFGFPQRRSTGFDLNRLQLIIAVLEKRANLDLSDQDVFVNIAGGFKIKETAIDLAVAMAITSSIKNMPVNEKTCIFGEIGLSGEIRNVVFDKKRFAESERMGFNRKVKSKNIKQAIDEVFTDQKK